MNILFAFVYLCIFQGDKIRNYCFILSMNLNNLIELCDKVNRIKSWIIN